MALLSPVLAPDRLSEQEGFDALAGMPTVTHWIDIDKQVVADNRTKQGQEIGCGGSNFRHMYRCHGLMVPLVCVDVFSVSF